MSSQQLPPDASLEYLKKLAKERLRELRADDPGAKLARAQLAIAREHGFTSWRALKSEVERRRAPAIERLLRACRAGDERSARILLAEEPGLVRERAHGTTALHQAVRHPALVELLLERGADPNAREEGDNALPLHFAAGTGALESARLLLDAGSDVHGYGDAHAGEVIGWAACGNPGPHRAMVELLLKYGARHHIFSALALNDAELVRQVVAEDPHALERRLSQYEGGQTPLHYVLFAPDGLGPRALLPQYDMLDVLLELGMDPEAKDAKGRTVLELALLRGERETAKRLRAAGARMPEVERREGKMTSPSVKGLAPMLRVADMRATLAWYESIGFRIQGTNENEPGTVDWASVVLGGYELMFVPGGSVGEKEITLWFYTDQVDAIHAELRARQLSGAKPEVPFVEDLHDAFYGMRHFSIRDPSGYVLYFAQEVG